MSDSKKMKLPEHSLWLRTEALEYCVCCQATNRIVSLTSLKNNSVEIPTATQEDKGRR